MLWLRFVSAQLLNCLLLGSKRRVKTFYEARLIVLAINANKSGIEVRCALGSIVILTYR
jgi:hypothetical protein